MSATVSSSKRVSHATGERVRRLVRRQAPDVEITPPELAGLRLVVPRGADHLYGEGYEPDVRAALCGLVKPGDVCADVGAHIGYFTMMIAQLVGPDGRVIAFEASKDMAGYLEQNVGLNRSDTPIEVCRAAVTDGSAATVDLYSGAPGSEMRSTIFEGFAEREAQTGRRVISVPAVALDDCFGPGERLDLVKIDIEGAEGVALAGAKRILEEQRPVFVVEFHRDVGWPALGHLVRAGYRFERIGGSRIDTAADPRHVPFHFVALPA